MSSDSYACVQYENDTFLARQPVRPMSLEPPGYPIVSRDSGRSRSITQANIVANRLHTILSILQNDGLFYDEEPRCFHSANPEALGMGIWCSKSERNLRGSRK